MIETAPENEFGVEVFATAPFQNHKTSCPYLVGSYDRVAHELARYIVAGYRTLILDISPHQEELTHINVVLTRAIKEAQNGGVVTAISNQTG